MVRFIANNYLFRNDNTDYTIQSAQSEPSDGSL